METEKTDKQGVEKVHRLITEQEKVNAKMKSLNRAGVIISV